VDARVVLHNFELRLQVRSLLPVTYSATGVNPAVKKRRVGRVDLAFQRLQPVAFLDPHGHVRVLGRHHVPFHAGKRRRFGVRPHVGPQHAVAFLDRIRLHANPLEHGRVLRLGRHFLAAAVDRELPAVVHAAQAALLVAAEQQRRAAVRAGLVHQPHLPAAVAEGDEFFAQQAHAVRQAIGRHVAREQEGNPVQPHQLAHRRSGADANQQLVVFVGQHVLPFN
jgi:hypothetical protein